MRVMMKKKAKKLVVARAVMIMKQEIPPWPLAIAREGLAMRSQASTFTVVEVEGYERRTNPDAPPACQADARTN
jgi:hypothetical protein